MSKPAGKNQRKKASAASAAAPAVESDDSEDLGLVDTETEESNEPLPLPFSLVAEKMVMSLMNNLPKFSKEMVKALMFMGLSLKDMLIHMTLKARGWDFDAQQHFIKLSSLPKDKWEEEDKKDVDRYLKLADGEYTPFELMFQVEGDGDRRTLREDLAFCGAFAAARTPVLFTEDEWNRGFSAANLAKLKEIADFYDIRLTKKNQPRTAKRIPLLPHEATFARIGILMAVQVARIRKEMNMKAQVVVAYPMRYTGKEFREDSFPLALQFSAVATICPNGWNSLFLSIIEYLVYVDKKINKKSGAVTPRDTIVSIAEASRDSSHVPQDERVVLMGDLGVKDRLWIPSTSEATADFSKTEAFKAFVVYVDIEDPKISLSSTLSGLGTQMMDYLYSKNFIIKKETESSGYLVFNKKTFETARESL